MNLTKWDPFRELEDMSQRLNRIFGRSLIQRDKDTDVMKAVDWAPAVDISETDGEYVIKAELPDIRKEDVKVTLDAGVLTITGERRQEKEDKGTRFHRVERSYGSFLRSFDLPDNVDEGNVKAEFKDGLLSLRLPKSAKSKPKAVEVKVD